jgi:hydroxyacylglutathione hydrolase
MIFSWLCPGLLATGPILPGVGAIRDGFVNVYVVRGAEGIVCIDAGWRSSRVRCGFVQLGLRPENVRAVLLTHMHWDHARGVRAFPNAEVLLGALELPRHMPGWCRTPRPITPVAPGARLTVAGLPVEVIATPGHTPGAVAYLVDGRWLFTGDALRLTNGQARPFPAICNDDQRMAKESLHQLAPMAGCAQAIFTGHTGCTTAPAAAFAGWERTDRSHRAGEEMPT